MNLKEYLKEHQVILDGSMGTYYCSIVNQPNAVPELANLLNPAVIKQIHLDYIKAGARLIRTNTFAASCALLHCGEDEQEKIVKAGCRLAKEAVQESLDCEKRDQTARAKAEGQNRAANPATESQKAETMTEADGRQQGGVWILGDIGPIPETAESEEEAVLAEYKKLCDIFMEEGLDGIHFETFSSPHYIEELTAYIKGIRPDMFVMASFCVNKNGFTASGIRAARILEKVAQIEGIDACGLNCGVGSGHMQQLSKRICFPKGKYIYLSPNAGYPEQLHNRMVFMDNARYFAENMKLMADLGIDLLGGCCGTSPEYIRTLVQELSGRERRSRQRVASGVAVGSVEPVKENEFYQLLQSGRKVIAVELDPPYDANIDRIMECAHVVKAKGADVITFADSPLGRSRVDSVLMGIKIAEETGLTVMPHICCRDRNMISMRSVLLGAYIHGIRNLLLVTGDPVPGESRVSTSAVFDYNSIQLMEYVKEMNMEHFSADPIYYGGALNHGRGSVERVVMRMKRKIDAGAKYFLTQPIYSQEDVERIKRIKELVDTKILCGIMPLVSYRNASFIKNEMGQIHVPDEIISRYHPDMSREEAEQVGAQIAIEVMQMLDPVADGYYFMLPFNRVSLMDKIMA